MTAKKPVSNINCCVYGCHTKKGRESHLSFHSFPIEKAGYVFITNNFGNQEKVDRKKAWEKALLMGKRTTSYMRVCSLHFNPEDFILPGIPNIRPRLKKNAVPSQNLPKKSIVSAPSKGRLKCSNRKLKRLAEICVLSKHDQTNEEEKENLNPLPQQEGEMNLRKRKYSELLNKEQEAVSSLLKLVNPPAELTYEDKGVQVKSGDIYVPFCSAINTNQKLNSLTGVPNFEKLYLIRDMYSENYPQSRKQKLNVTEKIILTLMKMKTGVRYVVLSTLFDVVSSKTCKVIFHDTISKLGAILKAAVYFPTLEECQQNLPTCFQNFPTVRVVLDCIELTMEKPKQLCCHVLTYSHYKGAHTIKFMTGVTPAGSINFVSKAFGGRASDKSIFDESNLISKLDMGRDSIMVDKGFHIDDVTRKHFIKVVQPPFLRKRKQFTEQEATQTVEIARARVHVERANQRIRIFEIFKKPIPSTLVPRIEDMFNVACGVVNISAPILADNRFLK